MATMGEVSDNRVFHECPSFENCGANECPLDFMMLERFSLPGEADCRARRATRIAIAARYPDLPTGGLTRAEIVHDRQSALRKARWAALPPEEQVRRLAALADIRLKRAASRENSLAGDRELEVETNGR